MRKRRLTRLAAVSAAGIICAAALSTRGYADEWNERTILMFSAPVMVPGSTLQPGKYEFRLSDSRSSRQVVQIFADGGQEIVASMMAVPIKRDKASEDVIVQFNPTDRGTPPALKSWFYPGSRYGHELVYPEEQARQIAERSKTVVLSIDTPGSDVEKGVLHTVDPSGTRAEWRGDAATLKEWDTWRRSRASSTSNDTSPAECQKGTAVAIRGNFQGARVELDDLEDNPSKYIGQTISVDGEVEEVLGPRVFTIDESNWGDLDGEILVFMPTHLVAFVRDDDRVTVTGTMQPFVAAELKREWGWFDLDPEMEVDLAVKPVLVAERIVGGNNDEALVIDTRRDAAAPVGTAGRNAAAALDDVAEVARGDEELVGRQVTLKNVSVTRVAKNGGFFVESGEDVLFVLPADRTSTVRAGGMVSIDGVILQMPDRMDERLEPPDRLNPSIYVYAERLEG